MQNRVFGALLALVLAFGGVAQAAAVKARGPSAYLRCDGYPAHRSGGENAARALVVIATMGLAGMGERADTGKRLVGDDGIAACNTALDSESDPIRKVRLMLARAVHNIEAAHYEAALTDARSAPALAGAQENDLGFRHSLLVSAMHLEALALARLNRPQEAEATALNMAAIAPYDLIAQDYAAIIVGLTAGMSPAKQDFLKRYGPLSERGLFVRPDAEEWAGRYGEAAADREAYRIQAEAFINVHSPGFSLVAIKAREAADRAMAGEMAQSQTLADEARSEVDDLVRSGQSLKITAAISEAEDLLDFQAVIAKLAAGQASAARTAFTARSRWTAPTPAMIADLVARLRVGAKPGELTGTLARDPAAIRADGLTAKLGALNHPENGDEQLYRFIRPQYEASDYTKWADDVRETEKSPFILEKDEKNKVNGSVVLIRLANGFPAGDALLMHCAFWAKAHGFNGFVLFPARTHLNRAIVRFGNAGDAGFPARAMLDADTVIKALEAEFPAPKK